MVKINDTLYCDGCGVEILCRPFTINRQVYCCGDCAAGLKCSCEGLLESDEERKDPYPFMPV